MDTTGLEAVALALSVAFFLDFMWAERPGKRMEASPWYELASKLAIDLLTARLRAAPEVHIAFAKHLLPDKSNTAQVFAAISTFSEIHSLRLQ